MGFLKRLFSRRKKEYEEVDESYESALDYLGSRIHNTDARKHYIEGCISQMKTASEEIDALNREYDSLTSHLNDMDEIDRLPEELKEPLIEVCKRINALEKESNRFYLRQSQMSEADYVKIGKIEDMMPKAYDDLKEAEEYQKKIKSDLHHIEGEKQAYYYRREEIKGMLANTKIVMFAAIGATVLCIAMLLGLSYGFDWDIKLGLVLTGLISAVTLTVIFVKNTDMQREAVRIEKSIVKLINLHNSVKIRYVNNTNLLDYLYVKYDVSNSNQLNKLWELYLVEKAEREKLDRAKEELPLYRQDLVKLLSRVHVSDPHIWLHQTEAILDRNEMVELRHEMIQSRQAVRGRIEENKRYGELAHDDLRDMMKRYPQYATEIMNMLEAQA